MMNRNPALAAILAMAADVEEHRRKPPEVGPLLIQKRMRYGFGPRWPGLCAPNPAPPGKFRDPKTNRQHPFPVERYVWNAANGTAVRSNTVRGGSRYVPAPPRNANARR